MRYAFRYTIGRKIGYHFQYDLRPKLNVESEAARFYHPFKNIMEESSVSNLFASRKNIINYVGELLKSMKTEARAEYQSAAEKHEYMSYLSDASNMLESNQVHNIEQSNIFDLSTPNEISIDVMLNYMLNTIIAALNLTPDNETTVKNYTVTNIHYDNDRGATAYTEKAITADINQQIAQSYEKQTLNVFESLSEFISSKEVDVEQIVKLIKTLTKNAINQDSNTISVDKKYIFLENATNIKHYGKEITVNYAQTLLKALQSILINGTSKLFTEYKKTVYTTSEQHAIIQNKALILKNLESLFKTIFKKYILQEEQYRGEQIQKLDMLSETDINLIADKAMNAMSILLENTEAFKTSVKLYEDYENNKLNLSTESRNITEESEIKSLLLLVKSIIQEYAKSVSYKNKIDVALESNTELEKIVNLIHENDIDMNKLVELNDTDKAALLLVMAEARKHEETTVNYSLKAIMQESAELMQEPIIHALSENESQMKLYRQFWFLQSSQNKDWILLPMDYNNGIDHPIPEGAELGLDRIGVSIEIMVDFINIIMLILTRFRTALAGYTGLDAVSSFVHVVWQWITLDTSREAESIAEYDRCFRWLRWESEKIIYMARSNPELNGLYLLDMLISEMIQYMVHHHFNFMPLFERLEIMDIMRNVFDDPQGDIPFIINKVKMIKEIILGG